MFHMLWATHLNLILDGKRTVSGSNGGDVRTSVENRIDEGLQIGFRLTALHEIAATLLGARVDAEHRIPEVYLPQARRPIHLGNP